jgi:hypothetical protein
MLKGGWFAEKVDVRVAAAADRDATHSFARQHHAETSCASSSVDNNNVRDQTTGDVSLFRCQIMETLFVGGIWKRFAICR